MAASSTTSKAAGPFDGEKAVVLVYGPSGTGKSTDFLYSFPRAMFAAPPGALKPAYNLIGHVPDRAPKEVRTVEDAKNLVLDISRHHPGKYDGVVVDDFSLVTEATFSGLEKTKSGFKLFGALRDQVLEFRDVARHSGLNIFLNAHEQKPQPEKGIRGGPRLSGRLPEDMPTVCDLVLRTAFDNTRKGWHYCYRCTEDDTQYVTRDRHHATPDRAPMNTGEILRNAGYVIRRAPGLEWQEEMVSLLSASLVETETEGHSELMQEAVEIMTEQHGGVKLPSGMITDDRHYRWVLRDALDRASLTRARANVYAKFL